MLTKKGTAKCDFCGRFVSWFDIDNKIAHSNYYEWFGLTIGGYEGPFGEFDVTCIRCLRKRRSNEKVIDRLLKKIKEA
jgi:hypothetical protein